MNALAHTPIRLDGDPATRGHMHALAAGTLQAAVVDAVHHRLALAAAIRERAAARTLLDAQWAFGHETCAPEMAEIAGIATGLGIEPRALHDYLHLGVIADLATADGCSAWAVTLDDGGAAVGKNRDFRGEHGALQRVLRQCDPAWGGRTMLCVGSLGSPGAYSSGMNSDGLAVADTQIGCADHGRGWLRYLLMTRLLATCADVTEALELLHAVPHVGGGSLVLADAGGALAAVDLGHPAAVSTGVTRGSVARTNHFRLPGPGRREPDERAAANSRARLETVESALAAAPGRADHMPAVMASHDSEAGAGLCRHQEALGFRTLSAVIFDCARRTMRYTPDIPCSTPWVEIGFD